MRQRSEAGETLLEILIALIIIGLVVGAFLASYATASTGSSAQRDLVTADAILRDFAEATKNAVEHCTPGGTYSVSYSISATTPDFARWPAPSPLPGSTQNCPPTTGGGVQQVDLSVQLPSGNTKHLSIDVRTP